MIKLFKKLDYQLLDSSDLFISQSFHEGLPIAALEAGSRKVPCLLYDIPGYAQFNQEKENVILFNGENFTEKIKRILETKEELKESFYQLIKEKYSIETMTQKVIQLYKGVNGA